MRLGSTFKILVCATAVACSQASDGQRSAHRQPEEPVSPPAVDWEEFEKTLRDRVLEWGENDDLFRDDGYTYTVDVAQLLTYAALRRDEELYTVLLPLVLRNRVDHRDDAYVRGFVTWRSGGNADASGTTEALRVVEALWRGSSAFDRDSDRKASYAILDGYRRHEYVDQGIWFIRNYYNLRTRSFATNSFLVDYDPDLIAEFARESHEWVELSKHVNELVRSAVTPSGLLHELVQPELLTAMPSLGTATFSPNNRAQLSNSCAVLERSIHTHRQLAQDLLRFAQIQNSLAIIYDVESGAPRSEALAGVETLGCLTRLAYRLDKEATSFEQALDWYIRDFLAHEPQPRAYTASEFLLTAYYRSPEPSPGTQLADAP